jgi:hypothetical protein
MLDAILGSYGLHHHRPEDAGSIYLWNICILLRDYMMPHPTHKTFITQFTLCTNYVQGIPVATRPK